MKDISAITVDEMRTEIRDYISNRFEEEENYVFISYSHKDEDWVYPIVLGWMRSGYNIYIDVDFERHTSDMTWLGLMKAHINNCCLAVCFKSLNYGYSYAVLLELLNMTSADTRDSHGHEALPVSVISHPTSPMPLRPGKPPEEYREYFESDLKGKYIGAWFGKNNEAERDALRSGLEDWLSEETRHKLGYQKSAEEETRRLMDLLDQDYRSGWTKFFRHIASRIIDWFAAQNLTLGDNPPDPDPPYFKTLGVWQFHSGDACPPDAPDEAPAPEEPRQEAEVETGDPAAQLRLAFEFNEEGKRLHKTDRDKAGAQFAQAFHWFTAAERNAGENEAIRARARLQLGICYDMGRGVSRDRVRAAILYNQVLQSGGAEQNTANIARERLDRLEADAGKRGGKLLFLLADHYYKVKDYPQAIHYLEAVEQSQGAEPTLLARAKLFLGQCYEYAQRYDEAADKYDEVANGPLRKVDPARRKTAERCLGYCYLKGQGRPQDSGQAAALFERAAEPEGAHPGDRNAQYALGQYYEAANDPDLARHWYEMAAGQSYEPAQRALDALNGARPE